MKLVWHAVRALCWVVIVGAAAGNVLLALEGNERAVSLLLSIASAAGFLVPLWLLWKLAAYSRRKIRSDAR